MPQAEESTERRRGKYLVKTWAKFSLTKLNFKGVLVKDLFALNRSLAMKTIRFYKHNLNTLKAIYAIDDMVEPSKIAGLMAYALLKFRPLVPINGMHECEEIEDNDCNELMAALHGIDICAAYYDSGILSMKSFMSSNKTWFDKWLRQFMYLVLEREYTAESLIMIFETLCMAVFAIGTPSTDY
jgi:hypothetical protein